MKIPAQDILQVADQISTNHEPRDRPHFALRAIAISLGLATASVLVFACVVGVFGGWQSCLVVITFSSAIGGLGKSLIDIHLAIDKAVGPKGPLAADDKEQSFRLVPISVLALSSGILIGAWPLPRVIDYVFRSAASIDIPSRVTPLQDIGLSWRNIPEGEDLCISVRKVGRTGEFILSCRSVGTRHGSFGAQAEIGGSDDADKLFEIRVFELRRDAAAQLEQRIQGDPYVSRLPDGAQVLASKTVRRIATSNN